MRGLAVGAAAHGDVVVRAHAPALHVVGEEPAGVERGVAHAAEDLEPLAGVGGGEGLLQTVDERLVGGGEGLAAE